MRRGVKAAVECIETCLREIRMAPRVWWRFGTLWPGRVSMADVGAEIHFDKRDNRARRRLLFDTVRGRAGRNVRFWRECIAHVAPDIALDVGANYGECVFGTTYPNATRALAIEANPRLLPYLRKSLEGHPDREKIEVLNLIASDEPGDGVKFYINPLRSGESTAIAAIAGETNASECIEVAADTVDALFAGRGYRPDRLVFKLDVEGFEIRVLQGMRSVLDSATLAVGYVEVDSHYLERSGWSIDRYDREILSRFELYIPTDKQSLSLERAPSLRSVLQRSRGRRLHTDMVLVKRPAGFDWCPPQWKQLDDAQAT